MSKSNSKKLVCPLCFQIARSTDPDPQLVCMRCMVPMKIAPSRRSAPPAAPELPPEPSQEDINRSLDS